MNSINSTVLIYEWIVQTDLERDYHSGLNMARCWL